MHKRIYCNPLNIDYYYQEVSTGEAHRAVYRESADPTILLYQNKYLMFSSMTGGFWWSENLIDWKFVEKKELPGTDYAPDVREIDGFLYFCASGKMKNCSIYRTKNPFTEPFEEVSELFPFWDPHLFADDDGKVYLYWGCSNKEPLYGIELDKETFQPVTERVSLIEADIINHGWERTGVNNEPGWFEDEYSKAVAQYVGTAPYIEGAYMTKYNGHYYLQYAAPATERNTYGDGVYVSDCPLGPYTYCEHNPFSLKPGGFITGAGHGSTFQDKYGNWWHAATMRVGINHPMERRIGIFPAGFDEEGVLFCNQNYADYPFVMPEGKVDSRLISPKYMLLSYKKDVVTTSELEEFPASNITNEDIRSIWIAKTNKPGEHVTIDLGSSMNVSAVQLNFADFKIPFMERPSERYSCSEHSKRYINMDSGRIRYILEGSADNNNWKIIADKSNTDESLCNDFVLLGDKVNYRYIRVTCLEVPYDQNFAISDVRVFGKGNGALPQEVDFELKEGEDGSLILNWKKAKDSIGYNIRYGIEKEKLYNSWIIYDETTLRLNGLNKGSKYFVSIDSFNENGITEGKIKSCKE